MWGSSRYVSFWRRPWTELCGIISSQGSQSARLYSPVSSSLSTSPLFQSFFLLLFLPAFVFLSPRQRFIPSGAFCGKSTDVKVRDKREESRNQEKRDHKCNENENTCSYLTFLTRSGHAHTHIWPEAGVFTQFDPLLAVSWCVGPQAGKHESINKDFEGKYLHRNMRREPAGCWYSPTVYVPLKMYECQEEMNDSEYWWDITNISYQPSCSNKCLDKMIHQKNFRFHLYKVNKL